MTYTSICMGQDNKKEQLSYAASLLYKLNKTIPQHLTNKIKRPA
ncbi:hypothetical protein U0X57_28905 [Bacillus thuringiensis]|jgi:hypothetical protein|nr:MULTISPECIES: hypothetical protein [Bacillus cereus group]AGE75612.1 hypothetical protein HD73_0023 [Bacillus thuringiensis serovar kurstaki str. HD73]AIM28721.1 hypothetical protein DF16_orf00305 [Bacillus thuringiensis serovar kurstaki str. YBT-1520]EEL58327.1 hypothetical protein bcere0023_250 [Bacillus cereus Rock4-2]EEM55600.1 hypothetical protein bthur0006_160 [Bacillus thuringiensis serovar kurstaki str. T03a001]KEH45738.1 hypothetical protein BG09_5582 [Bacillus thuringiensis serova